MSSVFEELFAINSAIGAIGAIAGSGIHQRQMSIRAKKTPVEFGGVYLGPPEGDSIEAKIRLAEYSTILF